MTALRLKVLFAMASICFAVTLSGAARDHSEHRAHACAVVPGIARIPAGDVLFGEDGPGHPGTAMHVPAFRIDTTEVTNRDFAAFVAATGYITAAEREGRSAVFVIPMQLDSGTGDTSQWWHMVDGASWRQPQGPGSDIVARGAFPVVHVTYADAAAYARWRGGELPTEVQWERAARGKQYAARDRMSWAKGSRGRWQANVWQGIFPLIDSREDGHPGTAPVGCYAPNEFGLYDMIGNVWEWTRAGDQAAAVRGGSFLCAEHYCANFRAAGRQVQEHDLGTSHVGFRVAYP